MSTTETDESDFAPLVIMLDRPALTAVARSVQAYQAWNDDQAPERDGEKLWNDRMAAALALADEIHRLARARPLADDDAE